MRQLAKVAWVCLWTGIATACDADLPPDTMRQLRSPVSGYRGELSGVWIAPEGDPSLPPGPDFVKMAERALHYLGNNPVPENNYQCRFWNMLLLCPPAPLPDPKKDLLDATAVGDTESRNDIAFNQMREMCGSDHGRKAQEEVHKRLVGYIRSGTGQVGDDMCWCYLYAGSPDVDSPYANPWATCKLLQSEVDLYRLTGDESHKKLARRLFEGLRRAASWDSGRAYYPNGGQGFKPGKHARGYEGHYPHIIGPVTYYGLHCKDADAIPFAQAMAEGFLADVQPHHLHHPDGSIRGHNHVIMHAVRGVAELGALANSVRYLDWVKAAYKHYNENPENMFDTGWLPESLGLADHNNHTEMCLVADMMEIELWLARAGWPAYWDRVDRTIRNLIVPAQFELTPAVETMWREVHQGKPEAEIERSLQLLRDFQGGFLSAPTPNDRVFELNPKGGHHGSAVYRDRKIVLDMMGCCPPEGMRALYLAWRDTVVETHDGILINLAFDRDAPKAKVVSEMPRKGRLVVSAKAAGDYLLRPPGWAPRSAVRALRGGKPVEVRWGGPALAYVVFPKAVAGDTLEITWPLVKFTQRVTHKIFDGSEQRTYLYAWTGSTVTGVDPYGQWLPLYGRMAPSNAGLEVWHNPPGTELSVSHNPKSHPLSLAGTDLVWAPGQLAFHPGPAGEFSVVRWTAPAAGKHRVKARFVGIHGTGTSTDVHVLHNRKELFTSHINLHGRGNTDEFSSEVVVGPGDTLDFVVGFGNGSHGADSTGLSVTSDSEQGQTYDAARDFSLAKNPNGAWSYGALNPGPKPDPTTFRVYTTAETIGSTLRETNR